MDRKKCMIVGLPGSGKSTFLGALWYNLCNNEGKMLMKKGDFPSQITLLQKLENLWQRVEKIERNSTEQNIVDDVEIILKQNDTQEEITLNVPDFCGEKFYNIVEQGNTDEIEEWCKESDSLLYMVSDVRSNMFIDDDKMDNQSEGDEDVLPLDAKQMSPAAINMMILKFLLAHKKFKRVVLAITRWDKVINDGIEPKNMENPEIWLKNNSPAFYNFVKHFFPDVYIIGLSAQGCDYEKEGFDKEAVLIKTEDGNRAYVCDDDIHYDLSLPLNFLLS